MSSHLLWFRLPKGRVWHVAASGALVALCGQSIPARGERQPKRPPFGARPCPDCGAVNLEASKAWTAALDRFTEVLVAHPRKEDASLPLYPEVAKLPACEDCGHVFGNHDSLGVCQDVDENGDACECGEYLAVCHCQHPWALHDVDTGECCHVAEDPSESDDHPSTCVCTEFRP